MTPTQALRRVEAAISKYVPVEAWEDVDPALNALWEHVLLGEQ